MRSNTHGMKTCEASRAANSTPRLCVRLSSAASAASWWLQWRRRLEGLPYTQLACNEAWILLEELVQLLEGPPREYHARHHQRATRACRSRRHQCSSAAPAGEVQHHASPLRCEAGESPARRDAVVDECVSSSGGRAVPGARRLRDRRHKEQCVPGVPHWGASAGDRRVMKVLPSLPRMHFISSDHQTARSRVRAGAPSLPRGGRRPPADWHFR